MLELIGVGALLFGGMAVLPIIYLLMEEWRRWRYWKRVERCRKEVRKRGNCNRKAS